jgi:hypothetical protein
VSEPNWVVRGGITTPSQLQAGAGRHLGVNDRSGLFGFSVQYQPGKTIAELATAGRFRNTLISVTTVEELIAAGGVVGCVISLVKSPGTGYHYTVQTPFPLPAELAVALSAVFQQSPNPARVVSQ